MQETICRLENYIRMFAAYIDSVAAGSLPLIVCGPSKITCIPAETTRMKVIVADKISERGVKLLKEQPGWKIVLNQ